MRYSNPARGSIPRVKLFHFPSMKLPPITPAPAPVPLMAQVDKMIDTRISTLSLDAWKAANMLPNGKIRKRYVPFTHPQEVHDLLALRQLLYAGTDPEAVAATLLSGDIAAAVNKAKKS